MALLANAEGLNSDASGTLSRADGSGDAMAGSGSHVVLVLPATVGRLFRPRGIEALVNMPCLQAFVGFDAGVETMPDRTRRYASFGPGCWKWGWQIA